ncbi:MAG: IS3 family transposase, partial [Candidatus Polarisedimenticolia bacterium]
MRLARERPRFGRRRLHVLRRRELPGINNKRVHGIYRRENLAVRRKQRKRLAREPRVPMPPATRPNECWSMDFTHDA